MNTSSSKYTLYNEVVNKKIVTEVFASRDFFKLLKLRYPIAALNRLGIRKTKEYNYNNLKSKVRQSKYLTPKTEFYVSKLALIISLQERQFTKQKKCYYIIPKSHIEYFLDTPYFYADPEFQFIALYTLGLSQDGIYNRTKNTPSPLTIDKQQKVCERIYEKYAINFDFNIEHKYS